MSYDSPGYRPRRDEFWSESDTDEDDTDNFSDQNQNPTLQISDDQAITGEAVDDFAAFSRYRGTGIISRPPPGPTPGAAGGYETVMCLHYFSDSLGFKFGEANEEVYRIDQIKEWAPTEPKWLEVPDSLG